MTDQFGQETALRARLIGYGIPPSLHDGLCRYLLAGVRPGGYLSAVLTNNLQDAMLRAGPPITPAHTLRLVKFLTYCTSSSCHGSPRAVEQWSALPPEYRPPLPLDDGPETLE